MAVRSGLQTHQFEQFVKPIETKVNAPWLRQEKNHAGEERIIVVDLERHTGRPATPDEIRDGKFYKDHAEFLQDRAA